MFLNETSPLKASERADQSLSLHKAALKEISSKIETAPVIALRQSSEISEKKSTNLNQNTVYNNLYSYGTI